MSLSLSSLLNPSPDSETRAPTSPQNTSLPPLQPVQSPEELEKRPSSSAHSNQTFANPPGAAQEAAQALAKLSASPVASQPHWNGFHAPDANQLERQRSWDRRSSGYGDHGITLPPPIPGSSSRKMSSPTLEQYQVASRSPEQRRASVVPPQEPNVTLAPLQGFASHSKDAQTSQSSKHELTQSSLPGASNAEPASLLASTATDHKLTASHSSDSAAAPRPTLQTSTSAAVELEVVSSPAIIKQETIPTPQPSSPNEASRASAADIHTSKSVASLKNEHSLKAQSPLREASIPIPSTETAAMEAPAVNPKKRPAPSRKKGTASTVKKEKVQPSKKRKIELKRSATPSSRASKAPTVKDSSAKGTPINSSPPPSTRSYSAEQNEDYDDDDEEDMDEDGSDGDVYCICRKPDNGTFMIGCDGTCDDWFHGKCVGIQERDKNLIDKYLCPGCTKKGIGQTSWKRMCRRGGCRQPAKVGKLKSGAIGSKYCSEECGVLYFREMAERTRGHDDGGKDRAARRKGSMAEPETSTTEDEIGARGGALSSGEVKALLNVSKTAEEFRKLGDGVLSPPATPDGQNEGGKSKYNDGETQALQRIQLEKEEARRRHGILKDRMKFVTLVKQAASRMATEKELKPKEFCGYDSRLEWTELRFQAWRSSQGGQQAFELDTLQTENSGKDQDSPDDQTEVSICDRKKCARHLDWSKLAVDDIRFEMSDNSDRMRALDKDEREMKERVTLRAQAGKNLEGTVEVHGLDIAAPPDAVGDKMDIDTAPLANPSVAETVEAI